jgi:AcrR family transcriptional regulator
MTTTVQQSPTETSERILQEAEQLFRHYGYAKTTMADIADACNMSPANLYRFFASKSALMEGICARVTGESERVFLQIANTPDEPASRRLERMFEEMYRHTLENLLDHRKVHEMVVVAMEQQWSAVKAHLDRICGIIQRIIEDGMKTGEFRAQDPERTARAVHASLVSICHPMIVAQKLDDEKRATPAELAALIIHSLRS